MTTDIRECRDYIERQMRKEGKYLDGFHFNPDAYKSEESAKLETWRLYDHIESRKNQRREKEKSADDEEFYFVPAYNGNGSVTYTDLISGKKLKFIRGEHGMFTIIGPRKFGTLFGGRGEFGQVGKDLYDKIMFNTK